MRRSCLLGGILAFPFWAGILTAGSGAHPPFSDKLTRFRASGFSVLLPEGFQGRAASEGQLADPNREGRRWLWGKVISQDGRFQDYELEEFKDGFSCTSRQGRIVVDAKEVETSVLQGYQYSCVSADGSELDAKGQESGWVRVLANSKRLDRRYVFDLRIAQPPRDEKVQDVIARIVASLREPFLRPKKAEQPDAPIFLY